MAARWFNPDTSGEGQSLRSTTRPITSDRKLFRLGAAFISPHESAYHANFGSPQLSRLRFIHGLDQTLKLPPSHRIIPRRREIPERAGTILFRASTAPASTVAPARPLEPAPARHQVPSGCQSMQTMWATAESEPTDSCSRQDHHGPLRRMCGKTHSLGDGSRTCRMAPSFRPRLRSPTER